MKVGFIGLGAMGRPMALHLQQAGHELFVWARRPASAANLPATLCASQAELGRHCSVVFSIITSSQDVKQGYPRREWPDQWTGSRLNAD